MINSTKIQLYSLATPNGQKIGVALEEMNLPYDAHTINIMKGDQFSPEFVAINPNSKIPAIIDPMGPGNAPIQLFESGAILLYLAEKSGRFLPGDSRKRYITIQWLFFQMAGVGPMFGQFGHFYKYAIERCQDPYPKERYSTEARRLMGVMDKQLAVNPFISGEEYTIADMAIFPWVNCLKVFYNAEEFLKLGEFMHVNRWLTCCLNRPAVKRGMEVCKI